LITLTLRALSLYGKKIVNSLRASEQALSKHCSCPPGQSCAVEINELPGRRFEVIVTRPSPVMERHDWSVLTSRSKGKYHRLFEKRTSMMRIRDAVAKMVGAPLENPRVALEPSPDERDIVLVDIASLQKVSKLIVGCQTCSPFAVTPISRILDRFNGAATAHTYYMLEKTARCPRCSRQVTEQTLVEVDAEA
jgi:hypothetical protein